MIWDRILRERKDAIASVAALIGVLSALLYVAGFVAERVHWYLLGHIEVPTNHIEFLYRGGVIVINSVFVFPVYLVSRIPDFDAESVLVMASIVTMVLGGYFVRLPSILRAHLKRPHGLLSLGFFVLLVLLLLELKTWPIPQKDLLFQKNPSTNTSLSQQAFHRYVGMLGLWLTFFLVCRHVWGVTTISTNGGSTKKADVGYVIHRGSPIPRLFSFVKRMSFTLILGHLFLLPAVYGSLYYPHIYPVVRVLLANDAPQELRLCTAGISAMALLYETEDDYVLYTRRQAQPILKVRKSAVSALVFHKNADITDPISLQKDSTGQGGVCVEK
jgi:hypothetical protein